jgi:hypothetical protein
MYLFHWGLISACLAASVVCFLTRKVSDVDLVGPESIADPFQQGRQLGHIQVSACLTEAMQFTHQLRVFECTACGLHQLHGDVVQVKPFMSEGAATKSPACCENWALTF